MDAFPSLDDIEQASSSLAGRVRETPAWRWIGDEVLSILGLNTEVFLKLELFQHTGTFKPRGAFMNMLALDGAQLERGVAAVSAGNHAIAVAWVARQLGTSAHVVMPQDANPGRIERCRELGAVVELVESGAAGFTRVEEIEASEGRTVVHPFEGRRTILGTATLGLEIARRIPELEAVVVPVGGGGLCAGVAAAIKQIQPRCKVFGVEPEGADTMHRSFAAGEPRSIDQVRTIATSLGAPHAERYSFAVCRRYVDDLVMVDDDALCVAMADLFASLKLAVEPAAAAAVAAAFGPLRKFLTGRRVALLICGTNTDIDTFTRQVRRGQEVRQR